jgi:hypothetical protein
MKNILNQNTSLNYSIPVPKKWGQWTRKGLDATMTHYARSIISKESVFMISGIVSFHCL